MPLFDYFDDAAWTALALFSGAMLALLVVAWFKTLFPPRR
jgi:hypothetical protein